MRAEGAAPGLAILAGLGGGAAGHIVVALLLGAAFVDGGKRQAPGQAAGSGAGIHPGQLEGDQSQGEVLRPLDETALAGVHEDAGDAGFVEGLEEGVLLGGPFVGVAGALGYEAGDRAARDGANGLHQHLQVIAVGEAPQDLPDVVAGQGAQVVGGVVQGHGWRPLLVDLSPSPV